MKNIDLAGQQPFAQGGNRYCFEHPSNPDVCLKILRQENIEARYQRQSSLKRTLGKSRLDDNHQELKAHRQIAIKKLIRTNQATLLWSHLPEFHGRIQTSLGQANQSELIRCADKSIAPTLENIIKQGGVSRDIQQAIFRFLSWLQNTNILTRNLLPHNLVVTDRSGQPELFLVDGLGAPTVPQLLASVPGWSSRYISRKIIRFRKRLEWEHNQEDISWEEFQQRR